MVVIVGCSNDRGISQNDDDNFNNEGVAMTAAVVIAAKSRVELVDAKTGNEAERCHLL